MSYVKSNNLTFNDSLLTIPIAQTFNPININSTTGFVIKEGTNPTDSYQARNDLRAAYAGFFIPLNYNFDLSGGVRVEDNLQTLTSKTYTNKPVNVNNPIFSILPSLNLAYHISDKSLIRTAYGKTINRPEFRELAPFAYYDFNFNNVIYGNSSLKTPTIHNFDIRYELYPSASETVSIGLFQKTFINPIEMFFVPGTGSGGTRNFTFGNADFANSYGGEIELRKSLYKLSSSFIKNLSIVSNASYIFSRVNLGDNAVGQSNKRPMMGQSPYIVNAGVYYTTSKMQINLLYNIIGPRLFAVGTFGTPDIYEMPRNVIDLSISKSFGKYVDVKIGMQDILNQHVNLIQDSNNDKKLNTRDEKIMSLKRGSYYTIGFTFKF
jgi:TonB-dependent receptor